MPKGLVKTSFRTVATNGMSGEEIQSVFPNIKSTQAFDLASREGPAVQPVSIARALNFPRPGGKNGDRFSFAIKWIKQSSHIPSGMKAFCMMGDFDGVYKAYCRDCLADRNANVKFPLSTVRFDEIRVENHINLRKYSKFTSFRRIEIKTIEKELKSLDHNNPADSEKIRELTDRKKLLDEETALSGLLRQAHQSSKLLSNLLKKSSTPFLKSNYQFLFEDGEGKVKARRSPLDAYKQFEMIPVGLDAAPSERERVAEEWFHNSKTLATKITPVSSKHTRKELKKKKLMEKVSFSALESESEVSEEERKPSKRKRGPEVDGDFAPHKH